VRHWFGLLMLTVLMIPLPACAPVSRIGGEQNDRVLFLLLGEQFDPREFWSLYIRTNMSLDEVDVSKYFALVVPGGPSAANVARFPKAAQIAVKFNADGKFIGTVCHGARLLMPEGISKNRPTTRVFMVADELCDQWKARDYGMYLDLPVVIDKNLITSRDPRDVPAMAEVLVDRFAESGGLKVAPRKARVLIILPGATKHLKWVLDRLSVFGISPIMWSSDSSVVADATSSDLLVILDRAFSQQTNSSLPLASIDLSTAQVIQPNNIAEARKQIVVSAGPAPGSKKVTYSDAERWADNYVKAAAVPIKGAPWNPAVRYDAVLALWNGYDDYAAARMNEFLAGAGRNVLVVGPKIGFLAGLNGARAEVVAIYDDQIKLSASPLIVAPGGVWPTKTKAQQAVQPQWVEADEPARRKRLDWLTGEYKSGKMLVAFGFDSLHIGRQKLFKRKRFASTDQASVIWFGSDGAEYSPERALFSGKNLLTAKPLVGVDPAIDLLREYLNRK
jgi:hypothetical protein